MSAWATRRKENYTMSLVKMDFELDLRLIRLDNIMSGDLTKRHETEVKLRRISANIIATRMYLGISLVLG